MRSFMRTTLIAVMLLASGSVFGVFGAQISIGISIGPPPPPLVVGVLPPRPDPEFLWVAGYWYPMGKRYKWHGGYWTRLPYAGAEWVPPHYDGERFFAGYWYGDQGRLEHNHRWDRERDRDCHRGHDRGRHRGHNQDHDR